MERRIRALEAVYRPPEAISVEFLIDSLPPMSAAVAERHEQFVAEVEAHGVTPVIPADPDRGITDDDLAEWVIRTFPHDMSIGAETCASLLVEAYWRRDASQYGNETAWRRQLDPEPIARRLAGRFSI